MTRKQLIKKQEEVFSKGLHAAMVCFRSPATGILEERHIYADEYMEIDQWTRQMEKAYMTMKAPFAIWINNHIDTHWKFEITEEDCKDE